jgi:S-adenosyl methyltransferase
MTAGDPLEVFRPDVPSTARMYDYYLGGKDNYPADREAAERLIAAMPPGTIVTAAVQNRAFLGRAVRYLAGEAGIRQFLDIGTGLPTMQSVHDVAGSISADCRVVYVDHDPVVLAHGHDMLHGVANATIIKHDVRQPDEILTDPELHSILDLTAPVAILLVAILHFVPDAGDPAGIVRQLMDAVPSGSYVAISHVSSDSFPQMDKAADVYKNATSAIRNRTRAEVEALFAGLDLVEPGIVWLPQWRPDPDSTLLDDPGRSLCWCGVARKG